MAARALVGDVMALRTREGAWRRCVVYQLSAGCVHVALLDGTRWQVQQTADCLRAVYVLPPPRCEVQDAQ